MEAFIVILIIVIIVIIAIAASSSERNIRKKGNQTVGRVANVSSHTYTGAYGSRHTVYSISYEFTDNNGKRWTGQKQRNSTRLSVGDEVTVYYLPDNPARNDADI